MEKHSLKKSKAIKLLNDAAYYRKEVGELADKLAHVCSLLLEDEENELALEAHNKIVEKKQMVHARALRDASVPFASLDKDKNLAKGTDGTMQFTPDNQLKLNAIIDEMEDAFMESVDEFMTAEIELNIPKIKKSELPAGLTIKQLKDFSLFIIND